MGGIHKAAQGGEAGDAAARAARAAGNAETGGVARFALIVGANRGVDPALPQLHYADDDAARYSELFGALGVRVHLLTRPDENTLRVSADAISNARPPVRAELARAVAELAREVATARELGRRVVFYFIYAGHGNVSGNTAYLALEDQRLDTGQIERQIVDRVGANETHLIIDACYSYSLAYVRGTGGIRHRDRAVRCDRGAGAPTRRGSAAVDHVDAGEPRVVQFPGRNLQSRGALRSRRRRRHRRRRPGELRRDRRRSSVEPTTRSPTSATARTSTRTPHEGAGQLVDLRQAPAAG